MSVAAYIIVHKNTAPHNCNKTVVLQFYCICADRYAAKQSLSDTDSRYA